jgi:two-component system, NarL family, sensor histidine kinase LiaS
MSVDHLRHERRHLSYVKEGSGGAMIKMTGRWLQPFRRLQWRLTLSYVLVAVVAMLTLALATAVLAVVTLQAKPSSSKVFANKGAIQIMYLEVAPYVEPYLGERPPDVVDLQRRMARLLQPPPKNKIDLSPAPYEQPYQLLVLGSGDRLLASAQTSGNRSGPPAGILANAQVQSALQVAWTGDQDSEQLVSHLPSGQVAVANPLIDYDNRVIGVALGIFPPDEASSASSVSPPSQQAAVSDALDKFIPGMLLFVLAATTLGILTGVIFSRSLTRRLRRITNAARDWSRGDLQVTVHDTSPDEIGQLAQDLNGMAGQLQQLVTARQELAVVLERHRLAQDLHDSIKQQLFVMTMLVGAARANAASQPEVRATLEDVEAIATGAHQELTALIRALRPVALPDGKPLAAALHDLIVSWSQSTGIDVVTHIDEDICAAPEVEQAIFRVTQEAIANIARHSGATALTIEADVREGALRLAVTDNGHGFDTARAQSWGLGISGMRERMETVGGELAIASGSGGSRIEARCPLQAAATTTV